MDKPSSLKALGQCEGLGQIQVDHCNNTSCLPKLFPRLFFSTWFRLFTLGSFSGFKIKSFNFLLLLFLVHGGMVFLSSVTVFSPIYGPYTISLCCSLSLGFISADVNYLIAAWLLETVDALL